MSLLRAASQDAAVALSEAPVVPEGAAMFLLGLGLILAASGLVAVPLVGGWFKHKLPREQVFFARWGFTHVVVIVLAWFLGAAVVGGLMGKEWIVTDSFLIELALGSLPFLVAAGFVGYYANKLHPERLHALGWRFDERTFLSMVMAWFSYFLVLPAIFGVGLLWMWAAPYLGIDYEQQDVLKNAMKLQGGERIVGLLVMAGLIPLLEEWLFRGFLQPLLIQNLRELGGIAMTSFCFAILHGPSAFAPVFCLSVFLGFIQLRSHRLPAAWLVHATHNASMLLLIWLAPETVEILG